jgi:glyoxylase-like metal-dependent hydrolase (beta-lactamase superfamily II)
MQGIQGRIASGVEWVPSTCKYSGAGEEIVLTKLSERVFILPGGVNIGVLRIDDRRCALIDTGLNDSSAKKAIKAARDGLGSDVVAIVTTHGHADHFGGNATVVKRTGARVYAPALDEAILKYPILQPALLYGGADPIDSMRTNFMLADPSPVDVIYDAGPLDVDGLRVDAVSLAGHSPNQMGILVDDVFFAADVVLPESVLDKYRIPYLFSLTDHLTALDRCTEVSANHVVPGHGPLLEGITELRNRNLSVVTETMDLVTAYCDVPRTSGEIMTHVLNGREATVSDAPGYYLLQPTINAYLTHLTRGGELVHEIARNRSTWQRT